MDFKHAPKSFEVLCDREIIDIEDDQEVSIETIVTVNILSDSLVLSNDISVPYKAILYVGEFNNPTAKYISILYKFNKSYFGKFYFSNSTTNNNSFSVLLLKINDLHSTFYKTLNNQRINCLNDQDLKSFS